MGVVLVVDGIGVYRTVVEYSFCCVHYVFFNIPMAPSLYWFLQSM
jgi:hypothetical protein